MAKLKVMFLSILIGLGIYFPITLINKPAEGKAQVKGASRIELKSTNKLLLEQAKNKIYLPQLPAGGSNQEDLDLAAESAIVVDAQTGKVLFDKNSQKSRPPASTAKIFTALVAAESMDMDKRLTVSEKAAATEPNKIGMVAGEEMRLEDLLYGLLMLSANDAAEVIAENYPGGRDAFIARINQKVKEMGLKGTVFKNPSGLDEDGFVSSPYDMAAILKYCIDKEPALIKMAGTKSYEVAPTAGLNNGHSYYHISQALTAYPYMIAAKPGFTDNAGHTLIGVAEKNGKKVIFAYFNSNDGIADSRKLCDYGFEKLGS